MRHPSSKLTNAGYETKIRMRWDAVAMLRQLQLMQQHRTGRFPSQSQIIDIIIRAAYEANAEAEADEGEAQAQEREQSRHGGRRGGR